MPYQKHLHKIIIGILLLVSALAVCQLRATAKETASEPSSNSIAKGDKSAIQPDGYVGSQTCKSCHEEQFNKLQTGKHRRIQFLPSSEAGTDGQCESCHGPGQAHVEGGGDKSKIFRFGATAGSTAADQKCLTCHQNNQDHQAFSRSVHSRNGVGCTACHSVHHASEDRFQLVQKQPGLCFSCHSDTRADFEKPSHHRVNEGLVNCSDCHNVHGSNLDKQLRTSSARDAVCLNCHAEKRGPFVFEHEVIKAEGCSACHTPHGSSNPRLLIRARVNSLCLECHTDIPQGPHPQNTRSQACTLCHSQIHGSNSSNVLFK